MNRLLWIAAAVVLVPLSFAIAQHHHEAAMKAAAPKVVELSVTDDGFVPEIVHVKAGEPITVRVTRKTDATCAKDIVIKSLGIKKALPLNSAVEVQLTPAKGSLRYACAMDMIAGTIVAD